MKKIRKEIVEALDFLKSNPSISLTAAGDMFGVSRHTIAKYQTVDIEEYKHFYNNCYYKLDDKEYKSIKYYLENKKATFADIHRKFGYKSERFKEKLKVVGENAERRYQCDFNRNLFETITTEEDAYWLGFILADGYVNGDRKFLNIKLGAVDRGHLVKFCKYTNCSESQIKTDKGGSGTIVYSLTLNSETVYNNLLKYGIFQGKSGKEKPYLEIEESLKPHYIRGVIDGDGWILKSLRGFGLVGSYEICKFFLDDMNISDSYIHEHGVIKKVDIRNQKDTYSFVERYYKNATIFLDRKMNLANQILEKESVAVVKSERKTGTL